MRPRISDELAERIDTYAVSRNLIETHEWGVKFSEVLDHLLKEIDVKDEVEREEHRKSESKTDKGMKEGLKEVNTSIATLFASNLVQAKLNKRIIDYCDALNEKTKILQEMIVRKKK